MNAGSRADGLEKIPWISLLVIALVFFYTVHNVRYTRFFAERGVSGYIVTEEEAQQIVAAFEKGQVTKAVAYLALAALGGLLLFVGKQNRLRVKDLLSGSVIFFVCWAFLSALWADNAPSTLNKLIILALLCVAIAGVLKRFSDRDILLLTFYAMAAYVAAGVASEVAMGSFRPWVAGYRFSGTCHPNGQALDCALLVFASWTLYRLDRRRIYLAVGTVAFILLILTKSRTSMAGVVIAPLALWMTGATHIQKFAFASFVGAVICFVLLASDIVMPALERGAMMGRTDTDVGHAATLTGRTDLWNEVIETYIAERPLLGYGYNSFWSVEHVQDATEAVGFIPGNAHSAFLDVFLGLGIFGLLSYVLMNIGAIARVVRLYHMSHNAIFAFFGVLLIFSMFHGITESTFLFPSLTTFICMLVLARLAFQDLPPEAASEPSAAAVSTAIKA